MSHRLILSTFFAVALEIASSPARGAAPVKEVQVVGPRVHLADVVPTVPAAVASADLGPAPAPGGSRFVTQDELRSAAAGAGAKVIASLPATVKVTRKMKKLTAAEVDKETRKAILAVGLRRGVTIAAVRAPKLSEVADGWTAVTASMPKPPRKTGRVPTTCALTFSRGTEVLARLAIPVDLDLAAEAAIPDTAKGAAVVVTVKSGLVEISAAALAAIDADVGEEILVNLRPSGKQLRAILIAPGKAEVSTASSAPSAPPPAASAPVASAPAASAPAPSVPPPAPPAPVVTIPPPSPSTPPPSASSSPPRGAP
ncbi:MAG: flagella basal body P-ring formation protein FlgA [Polyangiaceae bacterium]